MFGENLSWFVIRRNAHAFTWNVDIVTSSSRLLRRSIFSTENREAYEETGETHGIFVDSLKRHLTDISRVTHILEKTQEDVDKIGVQVGARAVAVFVFSQLNTKCGTFPFKSCF